MVEAFLFSPANSCPCNQVTSCHVILYHIMSYYVMYQTCIQIVSSVKHLLISLFVEWHGTYVLGQICIEFIPVGVAKKVWTALGGQHFFNHSGGGEDFSGISLSYLPVPPYLRIVHEPEVGVGKTNGPHLNSQTNLKDSWGVNNFRHLTELLANLPIT